MITEKTLLAIAPKAKPEIAHALAPALAKWLPYYKITTPLRIQHFLAQAAHETDGFKTLREYWGPTKAQIGYEGRKDLGNTQNGDGKRFMGRGIFQLTGRANYIKFGGRLALNLEGKPWLAEEPDIAVRIACEYWDNRDLNTWADQDSLNGVTRRINGGLNGLTDRKIYLERAKRAVLEPPAPRPPADMPQLDFPAQPAPTGFLAVLAAIIKAIAAIFSRKGT